MNNKYIRGEYLLYDCSSRHFVCTGKNEFELCKKQYERAKDSSLLKYPCIPYKSFQNQKNCIDNQRTLTEKGITEIFCQNEEIKKLR